MDYSVKSVIKDGSYVVVEYVRLSDNYEGKSFIYNEEKLIEFFNKIGSYFFDKNTMEFFGTRINSFSIDSDYFITSEKFPDLGRRYTIRKVNYKDIKIETFGQFGEYKNLAQAKRVLGKIKFIVS